jgi:hypothetical protein
MWVFATTTDAQTESALTAALALFQRFMSANTLSGSGVVSSSRSSGT